MRSSLDDSVSLFVDVPDLGWILDQGAFWDFCYEHCNCFTLRTLKNTIDARGSSARSRRSPSAGNIKAHSAKQGAPLRHPGQNMRSRARRNTRVKNKCGWTRARKLVAKTATDLWGMGAKGVDFASLIDADQLLGGIDVIPLNKVNSRRGQGLESHPPEWF